MLGKIMKISRLRMATDGDGISTLVGMYDCPLHCKYCINPFCHAKDTIVEEYTPEELVEIVSIDESYFKMTGGGLVFGGGEPLLQAEYIAEVGALISHKWQLRVETSLNVSWENVEKLIPFVSQWIIDIKDANSQIYKKYTGCENAIVLSNLEKIANQIDRKKIVVRVPSILGYNTEEDVRKTVEYLDTLCLKADVFEYIID